jgi:hypothetical protein
MTDLTAIDILIDPDEHAIERAREVNAMLLESMPQEWKLDDTHQPHITTLQRRRQPPLWRFGRVTMRGLSSSGGWLLPWALRAGRGHGSGHTWTG